MYNLLVTSEEGAWDRPSYAFDVERFLEYTDNDVKTRFATLDDVMVDVLKQLPALFAYERFVKSAGRVGRLTSLRKRGRNVTVSFAIEPDVRPIASTKLETLLAQLDIEKFEMNRTHWAVKRADLLGVLREAGLLRPRARQPSLKSLHPKVLEASGRLFTNGHYAEAIFRAFTAVEVRVRDLSGVESTGQDLMARAFNEDAPRINVKVEKGLSGKDEQRGFKFLFMGAMAGIRNPKGHGLVQQRDPRKTLEYLAFASLLMRRLDHEPKGE